MSEPIEFASTSPRFALPLLFPAQAQKEFYINEATSLVDALLHPVIEGEAAVPPGDASQGECWLVAEGASGSWADHEGQLATYQSGTWLFIAPRDGMRILDRSRGQDMFYHGGWQRAVPLSAPEGGSTVDVEARQAIGELIAALVAGGILPKL